MVAERAGAGEKAGQAGGIVGNSHFAGAAGKTAAAIEEQVVGDQIAAAEARGAEPLETLFGKIAAGRRPGEADRLGGADVAVGEVGQESVHPAIGLKVGAPLRAADKAGRIAGERRRGPDAKATRGD